MRNNLEFSSKEGEKMSDSQKIAAMHGIFYKKIKRLQSVGSRYNNEIRFFLLHFIFNPARYAVKWRIIKTWKIYWSRNDKKELKTKIKFVKCCREDKSVSNDLDQAYFNNFFLGQTWRIIKRKVLCLQYYSNNVLILLSTSK